MLDLIRNNILVMWARKLKYQFTHVLSLHAELQSNLFVIVPWKLGFFMHWKKYLAFFFFSDSSYVKYF